MIPQLMLEEEHMLLQIRPEFFVQISQQPPPKTEADAIDGIHGTPVAVRPPGIRQNVGPGDRDEPGVGWDQFPFAIRHERQLYGAAEPFAERQLRIAMVARILGPDHAQTRFRHIAGGDASQTEAIPFDPSLGGNSIFSRMIDRSVPARGQYANLEARRTECAPQRPINAVDS